MEETTLLPTLAEAGVPPPVQQLPEELREEESPVEKLARKDAAREGFPGEHWMVLALGIALWQFTRKHPNALVRAAGSVGAATLVARAASGREGLSRLLRWTPFGSGIRRACPPCDAREAR